MFLCCFLIIQALNNYVVYMQLKCILKESNYYVIMQNEIAICTYVYKQSTKLFNIQFNNGIHHFTVTIYPDAQRYQKRVYPSACEVLTELSVSPILSANSWQLFTTQSCSSTIVSLIFFPVSFCLLYPWHLSKTFLLGDKLFLYIIKRKAFFVLACA